MTTLVRIVLEGRVPAGRYSLGGVRIVQPTDDAELGRELRTVEVRCRSEREAAALRQIVEQESGLELVA